MAYKLNTLQVQALKNLESTTAVNALFGGSATFISLVITLIHFNWITLPLCIALAIYSGYSVLKSRLATRLLRVYDFYGFVNEGEVDTLIHMI